jgi:5'/3'-nucleotidase
MPEAPLILVTNDDGYDAPGLAALVEAVLPVGEVVVVAPDREQSGSAHALTLVRPLRAYKVADNRYRVDGTPTDCVHLGINALTGGRLPRLVVSGMNRGLNVGDDVTYSGTVAGALEGTLLHVPSIAFSVAINDGGNADFARALPLVGRLARIVLERGLPAGVLLNVNFPGEAYRGIRITRQGTRRYKATALARLDPVGRPYYWIDSVSATPTDEPDGDHRAIRDGYVSISPLAANLTHERSLGELTKWKLELD